MPYALTGAMLYSFSLATGRERRYVHMRDFIPLPERRSGRVPNVICRAGRRERSVWRVWRENVSVPR